jgi:hypothetical protein
MTDDNDELAALRAAQAQMAARIAELERAAKPPPAPDPRNFQRYDPTEGMSMPASAMREMARAIPDDMIRDIALRDSRAPTGPSAQGVVPSSQPLSNVRVGGGGRSGWAHEIPLSNPPGVAILDRIMDHEDAKDRAELIERHARAQAMQRAAESKP